MRCRVWEKRIDIHSWSSVIDRLIYKIAESPDTIKKFVIKYPNLLCLEKIYSIRAKNRRTQARSWFSKQGSKYTLVKNTFRNLGYSSLEEECEKHGGFVEQEHNLNIQEDCCFEILENTCKKIFNNFFMMDSWPERKIILNNKAVYHGMAVTFKRGKKLVNEKGLSIRYNIDEIYLKKSIFTIDGYFDGLATYVHELCHMFGGDSSDSFSQGLTSAMEILLSNQKYVEDGMIKWKAVFG